MSRRDVLLVALASAGGLLVGCRRRAAPLVPGAAELSPWVHIAPDGTITVSVDEAEMGQGVSTALPMILAEELRADFSRVKMMLAPSSWERFGYQVSAASTSIREGWPKLRLAGARAREVLIAAAAAEWGVPKSECAAAKSEVRHAATARVLGYGALAAKAARMEAPERPPLTEPSRFELIGKAVPRLDVPSKVDGSAVFGWDVEVPGMLTAVVARPPAFGARLVRFDATRAKQVPGVRHVAKIGAGVCVIAEHTWAALEGRRALEVEWDRSAFTLSTADIEARLAALDGTGEIVRDEGDVAKALAGGRKLEAVYQLPYLAHGAMEPMNATASVTRDAVTIHAPTQGPTWAREQAAAALGVRKDRVTVYPTFMGGGFGRRSDADFVVEAAEASKAAGAPVKVVWTREDDLRGGAYRPIARHVLRAALGEDGRPIAWSHHVACPKIGESGATSVEGAADVPYAIPNLRVRWADLALPVRTGFWRSVGHSHNAFAVECFADELAAAAGQDPVAYRRALLRAAGKERHLRVLDLAAEKAGWGAPLPEGRARGVAVHESFGTYVAQVVEVSASRVHRVVCAVDCGEVVHPDTVVAQMEGGIVFGLSAALHQETTIAGGAAVEGNFHQFPLLAIGETPAIEVHLAPGGAPIGGAGEPGVPPIAPAVANALRALTGAPRRRLPLRPGAAR